MGVALQKNVNEIKLTNGEAQDEWRGMERKGESKEDGENYDQVEQRKRLIGAAHTRLRAAVLVSNVRRNAAIDPSRWQWTDTEWIRLRPSKIYVVIVTFTHASHDVMS